MSDQPSPGVREYIRAVGRHGTDAFSLFSWGLALLVFPVWTIVTAQNNVPGPSGIQGVLLTALVGLVALLAGSFNAWRDAEVQLRQRADFVLSLGSVRFSLVSQRGEFPAGPDVHFQIDLDARNGGGELVRLHRPEISEFKIGTNLLADEPSEIQYTLLNPPHEGRALVSPFDIQSGTRPRIGVQLSVRHSFQSEERLAARLRDLGPYRIRLTYEFEDMAGRISDEIIDIDGSLNDYARRVAADLKKRKDHKLVDIILKNSPEMLEG